MTGCSGHGNFTNGMKGIRSTLTKKHTTQKQEDIGIHIGYKDVLSSQ